MDGSVAVDATDLDEGAQRLDRVVEDLGRAGEELAGLGGTSGMAVGADALLDALGDLARAWCARLDRLEGEATVLREELREARERYEANERDVVSLLLDTGIDTRGWTGTSP